MEHHRLPRHSASHGHLHSSYSSHGRPGHGLTSIRPLHKPLRSVNENSVLLPSPGALESMLKTTTETGDIGIFSIKPIPPSPRPSMEELHHRANGDKQSPSRDTASEIISMYGSESHKSATSTVTPTSSEGIGLRSYSMSTCGSRHLSYHKSNTTLQSHANGGPLQRPRSPFPYPTRLKRPGVRPASPALTENGRVDYSRMVEIDRASYRTGHRPYKPSYPPMPRRPPPLGLRAGVNLSTASLPPPSPFSSRNEPLGPPSLRTLSAASMASWSVPHPDRLDNSRTSSLTSNVNMYHRMPRTGPNSPSAATPRYYDYTEGFESGQHRVTTPVHPLAPVPTRASNRPQSLVLQESDDSLEAAFEAGDSAFFEYESHDLNEIGVARTTHGNDTSHAESPRTVPYRATSRCDTSSIRSESRSAIFEQPDGSRKFARGSDIDLLPSQAGRDSMDTFNPNLDLESKDASTYRYTDYRSISTPKTNKSSPERQVQVQDGGTPSVRSEQGVILRDYTQNEIIQEQSGQDEDTENLEERNMGSPPGDVTKRRSFSEPAESLPKDSIQDNALPEGRYKSVTVGRNDSHHSRTSTRASLIDANHKTTGGEDQSPRATEVDSKGDDVEGNDSVPLPVKQAPVVTTKPRFNHKRSRAVPRISTSSLPREDNEGYPHITPSCSTTTIVSPKPISPARQLKLKNSIPQLMKALPSLPGDPGYVPLLAPSIQSNSSNEGDFAEVLSPFKFSQSSTPWLFKGRGTENSETIPERDQTSVLQKNAPKLRLRMKMSNESGTTVSSDTKLFNPDTDNPCSPSTPSTKVGGYIPNSGDRVRARNRLKLRYSKSTILSTPPPETVRRNVDASASSIIADISHGRPRDLFSFSAGLNSETSPTNESSSQVAPSGRSSPASTLDATGSSRISRSSTRGDQNGNLTRETRSTENGRDSDIGHHHGLRGPLSNLRYLMAQSSDSTLDQIAARDKEGRRVDQDASQRSINVGNKQFVASHRRASRERRNRATLRRRMQAKLLKWVRGAKTAVKVCTKRNRRA